MSSIAFGVAVLFWIQCILAGRNENMIQKITSTYTGHLQVARKDYNESHLPAMSFNTEPRWPVEVQDQVSPRVHLPSLISSGEDSVPVMLEGIVPNSEARITRLKEELIQGEFLSDDARPTCDRHEVYIGQKLATLLHVGLGDKIVILAQATDGTLGNELLRVKGLFNSGSPDFDKSYVFSTLGCVQRIGSLNGIHEWVVRLKSSKSEERIKAMIAATLDQNVEVSTWREALPGVANMLKFNSATFQMITVILLIVIVLGVVNTMVMSVFERTKEFGVMLALGTTPGQLRWLVVAECLLTGAISILAGSILGILAVCYHRFFGFDLSPFFGKTTGSDGFQFDMIIHPIFEVGPFFKLIATIFIFILLAGLYPAYRASVLKPAETMRS